MALNRDALGEIIGRIEDLQNSSRRMTQEEKDALSKAKSELMRVFK